MYEKILEQWKYNLKLLLKQKRRGFKRLLLFCIYDFLESSVNDR